MKPHSRLISFLVATLSATSLHAAVGSWNYDNSVATNLRWDTAASWTASIIPNAVGDEAAFSLNITAARSITLNGDRTLGKLTIGDPTATFFGYSLNAGTPSTSRLIFDQTGIATATLHFNVASGVANTISAPILLNDSLEITSSVTTSTNPSQTLSGIITDADQSYSITKKGPGLLTLSGVNTFDGGVSIEQGKVTASNIASLGTGTASVSSGGQLFLSGTSGSYANALIVAGDGCTLATNETDTANLVGALRYAGSSTSGTLTVASSGARIGAISGTFGLHTGALAGSGNLNINSSATNHSGHILLQGDASGYTGTITVTQGSLRLGSNDMGGSISVADGGRIYLNNYQKNDSSPVIGTNSSATRSLTLGSSGGVQVHIDPSTTNPTAILGDVTLTGTNTINLGAAHSGIDTTILTYTGNLTGSTANLTLPGGIASYRAGTAFTVVPGSPNKINLNIVSENLIWNGTASSNWNSTDANWTSINFSNGDNVLFDDTPSASSITIAIPATIAPNKITVDSTKNYTFLGTGAIAGSAALTKSGNGSLTLANGANTFSGGITLLAGALYVNPTAGIGTAPVLTLSGGTFASNSTTALPLTTNAKISGTVGFGDTGKTGALTFNGIHTFASNSILNIVTSTSCVFNGTQTLPANLTISTPFSGSTNATCSFTGVTTMTSHTVINTSAAFNSSNQVTMTSVLTDGSSSYSLTKQGVGALRLNSANTYDGGTTITDGTIIAGNVGAFGSGNVTVENNGQAYLLTAGTYSTPFLIRGNGQTLNGLSNTAADGALHFNTSGQTLTGTVTLTGDARIGSYFSANAIISGNISEVAPAPEELGKFLEFGSPGAANGCGTLTVSGTNTYTGGTKISRVILRGYSSSAFGSGNVQIGGDNSTTLTTRLEVGKDVSLNNDIELHSVGRSHATPATNTWGAITGYPGDDTSSSLAVIQGDITIFATPSNGGHFATQGHASNSILRIMGSITSTLDPVKIANGTIELGGGGDYQSLVQSQGTLRLAAAQGIATTAVLDQAAAGAATFDLNGYAQTITGLKRSTGSNSATVTNNGASSATLTLAPHNGLTNTYPGSFVTGTSPLNLAIGGSSPSITELAGNSPNFSGTTSVSGHLRVSGTHGNSASTATTSTGATLSGKGIFGGNLTIGNGTKIDVDPSIAGNLSANGNLTVNGTVTVNLLQVSTNPIVVMSCAGTLSANANQFVLANASSYPAATFTVIGNQVILTTASVNLTWTGLGGSTWNLNTTSNWTDGSPRTFLNGYNTAFTDAPASNQTINVATAVAPAAITFNNSSRSYRFENTGNGAIQGGTLTKEGSNQVTFGVPLSLTGGMTLNQGSVVLESPDNGIDPIHFTASVTGTATLTTAAGLYNPISLSGNNSGFTGTLAVSRGELVLAQSNASGNASIVLGDSATTALDELVLTLSSGTNIANSVRVAPTSSYAAIKGPGTLQGAASLTKEGTGILEIYQANAYSGNTVIAGGTVKARVADAIPATSTMTMGTPSTGTDDTILSIAAGNSAYQTTLSAPLSLHSSASASRAILRRDPGQNANFAGTVTLNGRNLTIESAGIRLSGAISGTGNILIDTADSVTPVTLNSTANSFTGNIQVLSGSVQNSASTGAQNCIPDSSSVILGNNSAFLLNASDTINELTGTASSFLQQVGSNATLTVGSGNSSFTFDGQWQSGNLTKIGSGTMTLTGNNSSTGYLRVQGGSAIVNQSLAARIEVDQTCTLGGTGTVFFPSLNPGGHLPINGFLSPGHDSVGTLTVNNPLAMSETSGFTLQIADWNSTTPGTGHDLLVCPNLIFTGGGFLVKLDCAGLTNFSETAKTFTVAQATQQQFAPGINVTQFQVMNFAGTGTWKLLAQGNTLQLVYTPNAYGAWASAKNLNASNNAVTADPDQDGISNLQEFYFDGNPLANDPSILPQVTTDTNYLTLQFRRRDDAETAIATQQAQYGAALTSWLSSDIPAASTAADANGVIITVTENASNPDQIEVKIPRNLQSAGKLFGRVLITKAP